MDFAIVFTVKIWFENFRYMANFRFLTLTDPLSYLFLGVEYCSSAFIYSVFSLQWAEFMQVGKDLPDSAVQDRLKMQAPNKCCTLIYTSGTTGTPKGVMLSHDNVSMIVKIHCIYLSVADWKIYVSFPDFKMNKIW